MTSIIEKANHLALPDSVVRKYIILAMSQFQFVTSSTQLANDPKRLYRDLYRSSVFHLCLSICSLVLCLIEAG